MTALKPELKNISLDQWNHPIFLQNNLRVSVLRLDKIHPEISGNKWFKLKYYIEKAKQTNKQTLISFGGAYSNHLLALAAAARIYDFSCIGYIRGEESAKLSPTLLDAKEYGMDLRFLSRRDYDQKKKSSFLKFPDENGSVNPDETEYRFTDYDSKNFSESGVLLIPEGGAGPEGIRGAEEILSMVPFRGYSHICCAVGTGASLSGIINSAGSDQKIIGVSVLKGGRDFEPVNLSWIKNKAALDNVQMVHNDHFGGYAKYTKSLIDFMNRTFVESGIPTDFVYTGKLFYSLARLASIKSFPAQSRILVLHSGGLQGNRSLAPGLLQF